MFNLSGASLNFSRIRKTSTVGLKSFSLSAQFCQKKEPPWKILFFGTDDFSLASLLPLTAKLRTGTLMSKLGVISQQHSPVHKFATAENLEIHEWPPDKNVLEAYDIGMIVSYGKLMPENIINSLPLGILNVHGSLLPRWRGAAPIEYAIMNGDTETGVTIMRIKPHKFDTGDIVRQYRCSIGPNETTPELRARMASSGGQLLMECLRDLPRCLEMTTPQPKEGVTLAPKLTSAVAKIDWNLLSAKEVYNRHRALSYTLPLTTKWFNSHIKLHDISLAPEDGKHPAKQRVTAATYKSALDFLNDVKTNDSRPTSKLKGVVPGKIEFSFKMKVIKIQCGDGAWVTCDKIKVLTSRIMSGRDFYNGHLSKKGRETWIFG